MVEKQKNIDVQPIIYRLTQETVLNPTTIKTATYVSHQTVPSNINDNNTTAAIDSASVFAITDEPASPSSTSPNDYNNAEWKSSFNFLICPLIWQLTNYLCAT